MNELSFFDMLRPTKENKQYPYECKVCGSKMESNTFLLVDNETFASEPVYSHYERKHPFELSVLTTIKSKDKPSIYQ